MATLGVQQFRIDSSLELPADSYAAELPSATPFLEASPNDAVKLTAGFTDASGTYTVGHLEGGIDEYGLTLTPDRLLAQITGRDQIAKLLDRTSRTLYLVSPPTPGQEPDVPYVVGTFLASEVARQVV